MTFPAPIHPVLNTAHTDPTLFPQKCLILPHTRSFANTIIIPVCRKRYYLFLDQ